MPKNHDKNEENGKTPIRKNRVYKSNATCKICSKVFPDSWKLKRHEKIHIKSGELPEPTEEPEEEVVKPETKVVEDSRLLRPPR